MSTCALRWTVIALVTPLMFAVDSHVNCAQEIDWVVLDDDHDHDHFGDHSHHGQSHGFDYIYPYASHGRDESDAHGHAGHTSIEGYPFVHGLRTEIDFIERALEFDLAHTRGADGGTVDELEFESELVWALNSRMVFILGAPLISLDPVGDPNTTGIGDLEVGFQFLGFNGERSLNFFALNLTIPTGDRDRDLGAGFVTIAPTVLWLYDFGCGTYFQSRVAWAIPLSFDELGSEFSYDLGLYHTFVSTEDWHWFRFFTPGVEANGITALNGVDAGQTLLDMTVGFRWIVRDMDELGVGWSFPLTEQSLFDQQLIFSYRRHF